MSGGKAIRYGVGVGTAAFAWQGEAEIGRKQEWPRGPAKGDGEEGADPGPL